MSDSRPADIRLEDLEMPRFSESALEVIKQAAPMAKNIHFSLEALMEAAAAQEGLDDFGTEEYVEPYTVLCESIRKESNFGPMGKIGAWGQLLGFMVNRLRLTDFFKRHPEAENTEITKPIIIAGLPRSGTTHLHNLISADSNLRSLPWWEALEPIPSHSEWDTTEGRIQRAKDGVTGRNLFMPEFDRMHEMTWDHVHEEIHLLAAAGSSMLFDTMAILPTWREYYKSEDQTPYYLFLKRHLKAISFLRDGSKRWILKSPQHLEQFRPIMNAFPDATVAVTHRDPVSVLGSMATMLCYAGRLAYDSPIDIKKIGHWWKDMLTDMLDSCRLEREVLPAEQSIDVLFHEFMSNDVATVKNIYDLAGQPFTNEVEGAMQDYMETHPRGRHGRVLYDLNDFQISPQEAETGFGDYIEHFGIQLEPR